MPVFAYLAHPVNGAKKKLFQELRTLEYCEAAPADNEEIIILVTDTPDNETEEHLQKKLAEISSLQCLSMTFGHVDEKTLEG
jgi:nitrate reductase NapAB chaperone NapD